MLQRVAYETPTWAAHMRAPANGRVILTHAATPVFSWRISALKELGVKWLIKRDDLSGFEISGNKARKLEFLLGEALALGHDCVVTVGGMQSNHCRATAAAARLVGLEPHVVLLASDAKVDEDPGLEGNLLLDRMLGATLHLCPASDYYRHGGNLGAMKTIAHAAAAKLRAAGRNPYVVPVGASNGLGTWGYIDAVHELRQQLELDSGSNCPFDHIVMATGSAGSAAGVAMASRLSGLPVSVHAACVNGGVEEKYEEMGAIGEEMGCWSAGEGTASAREAISIYPGAGRGYALNTPAELEFAVRHSAEGGVLLDPTYTAKGLFHFCEAARASPDVFRGSRILFWHTGGQFGMWSKQAELARNLPTGQVERLLVP